MMRCFRVGIDLTGIFNEKRSEMYSEWWKIGSDRHPLRVFINIPYNKFIAHCLFYTCFLIILLIHVSNIGASFSGEKAKAHELIVFFFWISLFMIEAKQLYRSLERQNYTRTKPYQSYWWNKFDIFHSKALTYFLA